MAQGQPYEPTCGLLWWRLPTTTHYVLEDSRFKELEEMGLDKAFLAKVAPLRGRTFLDLKTYDEELLKLLGPDFQSALAKAFEGLDTGLARQVPLNFVGYSANGYRGQYLVVYPDEKLVAVRQIRSTDKYSEATDHFLDFANCVRSIGN